MKQKSEMISYSGSDRAIRNVYSSAIAYSKLAFLKTGKNGISYCLDVLFFHYIFTRTLVIQFATEL
jgi:hypothetical protein